VREEEERFGLFFNQKKKHDVQKKSGRIVSHRCGFRLTHKNTRNVFKSTQQNGFFCQPRDDDDDDEHRGEEHFE
jgi:hypothetical protein